MITTPQKAALAIVITTMAFACGGASGNEHGSNASAPPGASQDGGSGNVGPATPGDAGPITSPADPWSIGPPLGARRFANGDLEVRVRSAHATRIELCLFAESYGASELLRLPMDHAAAGAAGAAAADQFTIHVTAAQLQSANLGGDVAHEAPIFYGFRAYGPNWPFDPTFALGSLTGFVKDVDADGNRMNPNKLLLDPYALEVSHDPINLKNGDGSLFKSGDDKRQIDSGQVAPKGVILSSLTSSQSTTQLTRALRDDVVYEVHVRGMTMTDASVPDAERGTYAGAARRAKYLHDLGVTAIELLPLHESPNDQNDRTPDASGDNYWGYSTLSYFAPDRRYASDRSPGGPSRELRAMVDAFHAQGIKVFADVVFNHTAEGGAGGTGNTSATLYNFRGLDNETYYEVVATDKTTYVNSNGVGPNLNTAAPTTSDLVVHSLSYWKSVLGVDGFRFDLAPVVANSCTDTCYKFDKTGLVTRIAKDLPARPNDGGIGVDLIAEPWGLAAGSYQVGGFPAGWSEWNDHFRDTIRKSLNRLNVEPITPRDLSKRLAGSPDVYQAEGRPPASSINFVVAHDGMTLADLFAYDVKQNNQAFPFGPSSGGTDTDYAFSQGGDPVRQRAVARTAFAFAALSAGVPMITGGDERLRTQHGNNNAYNLDSTGTWLDWSANPISDAFSTFAANALAFRNAHQELRPAAHWGDAQVTWFKDDGTVADDAFLDASTNHYLGMKVGDSLFVAYSAASASANATLPTPPTGKTWSLAGDTSEAAEAWGNWHVAGTETPLTTNPYSLGRRTLAVFIAK